MQIQWSWVKGGLILGAIFLLAVVMVKPIGVSTQFVIFDGMVWSLFSDDVAKKDDTKKHGYSSSNKYLDKSGGKYAKNIDNPLNYSFIFILAMIGGGIVSAVSQKSKLSKEEKESPQVFRESGHGNRYLVSFIGGVLVLFGSRLAGGCTSGHMMSGMMQTSLSGYLFAIGTFGAGIPVAIYYYKRSQKGGE